MTEFRCTDGSAVGPRAVSVVLRGHYAYYDIAGNIRALQRLYRAVERYWCKVLRSRSWAGRHFTWADFNQLKERIPLLRPKLRLPYRALQAPAVGGPVAAEPKVRFSPHRF